MKKISFILFYILIPFISITFADYFYDYCKEVCEKVYVDDPKICDFLCDFKNFKIICMERCKIQESEEVCNIICEMALEDTKNRKDCFNNCVSEAGGYKNYYENCSVKCGMEISEEFFEKIKSNETINKEIEQLAKIVNKVIIKKINDTQIIELPESLPENVKVEGNKIITPVEKGSDYGILTILIRKENGINVVENTLLSVGKKVKVNETEQEITFDITLKEADTKVSLETKERNLTKEEKEKFEEIIKEENLGISSILVVIEVKKENLENDKIKNVSIKMRIDKNLVDKSGGKERVRILRKDNGNYEILPVKFIGEENGYYIFESISSGLSVYALVTVSYLTPEKHVEVVQGPQTMQFSFVLFVPIVIVIIAIIAIFYFLKMKK